MSLAGDGLVIFYGSPYSNVPIDQWAGVYQQLKTNCSEFLSFGLLQLLTNKQVYCFEIESDAILNGWDLKIRTKLINFMDILVKKMLLNLVNNVIYFIPECEPI